MTRSESEVDVRQAAQPPPQDRPAWRSPRWPVRWSDSRRRVGRVGRHQHRVRGARRRGCRRRLGPRPMGDAPRRPIRLHPRSSPLATPSPTCRRRTRSQVPAASLSDDVGHRLDYDKQHVMLAAMTQLGVPYRSRASKPGVGFDCSGLVALRLRARPGSRCPGVSGDQYQGRRQDRRRTRPSRATSCTTRATSASTSGCGLIVHSPQSGMDVEIARICPITSLQFGDGDLAIRHAVASAP